uniref:Thiol:disulfide interchange protein n=1 Tax=Candidatus Kentrum sp. SD TaxID=2126332 RepID=A0A451BS86_9GAMM|nr:MAG: thiol:disulfide interchange protein DsbC [Candidatus Kentron sp. SD]
MLRKYLFSVLAMSVLGSSASMAEKDFPLKPPAPVLQAAERIFAGGASSITPSPIPGLYETTSKMEILYISQDGKFAIQGDLVDLEKKENLTERRRNHARANAVDSLGEDSMIVFAPDDTRHTITVFTDVDCSYCRKLHGEVSELNSFGIAVRYLAFPRAGVPSGTYDTMVSVWCAKDRQKAMTDAKTGKAVPNKQCANPVEEHFALGAKVGIRGTPAIILEDGTLVSGYLPASRLRGIFEERSRDR